jgi:hypothetical protein
VAHLRAFRDDYTERVRSAIAEQLAVLDRVGDLPEIPSSVERLGTLSVEEPQRLMETGDLDSAARRSRASASPTAPLSAPQRGPAEDAPRRSAWNAKPAATGEGDTGRNASWSRPDGVWSAQNGRQGARPAPPPRDREPGNDMAVRRAAAGPRPGRPHTEGENRDSA